MTCQSGFNGYDATSTGPTGTTPESTPPQSVDRELVAYGAYTMTRHRQNSDRDDSDLDVPQPKGSPNGGGSSSTMRPRMGSFHKRGNASSASLAAVAEDQDYVPDLEEGDRRLTMFSQASADLYTETPKKSVCNKGTPATARTQRKLHANQSPLLASQQDGMAVSNSMPDFGSRPQLLRFASPEVVEYQQARNAHSGSVHGGSASGLEQNLIENVNFRKSKSYSEM